MRSRTVTEERELSPSGWTPARRARGGATAAIDFPVVRAQRDPADGMAVRMTVFSLTLLLVPTLGLVWVRYVWQEADDPGVTSVELLRRTGLIIAAGLLACLALRLAAAAVRGRPRPGGPRPADASLAVLIGRY